MKVTCIFLLACLAGFASAAPRQVTFSPPAAAIPSPPPPSPPGTPAAPTFNSPGLDFSLVIPGHTTASFGTAQQNALCGAITNNWSSATSAVSCTVGSVSAFNGTYVLVSGYAYFTYSAVPSITELQAASALRDARIAALSFNTTSVLGSVYPGAVPNCACNGLAAVTASSTATIAYTTNITGVPGPMQCGAKLTYDSTNGNSFVNQVGVDDGSVIFANLGKYCSTPAVVGGVIGLPGSGSCRQYGVIAAATGSTQATAVALVETGFVFGATALSGGSGYTSAPTVTVGAPNPLAAQVSYTLNTAFQPSTVVIASASNGPYSPSNLFARTNTYEGPEVTFLSNTCVDTGNTGATPTGHCTGTQATYQVNGISRTGAICQAGDVAVATLDGDTASLDGGLTFPSVSTTYCTSAPTITLSTATLQPAVTAQMTSIIKNGVVTGLAPVNFGSGYRTPPTITIAAPISNNIGKLCGPAVISALPSAISYTTASTISIDGSCQPLGRDTYLNQVCSIPAAPGGLYEPLNVGTCNVVSTFIAQPGSTVTSTCGVLPQSFVTSATTAPTPAPTPAPAPKPAPAPAPAPASVTCSYDGTYTIQSVACSGKFIAYNNDPKKNDACKNSTLMLRTDSQSKGARKQWKLSATAVSGTVPTASGILASGRTGKCENDKLTNLAAANSAPTPRLAGAGWKNRIIPVDASKGCDTVWIQAAGDSPNAGKYLGYGSCSSQTAFTWSAASSSTAIQWKLTKA